MPLREVTPRHWKNCLQRRLSRTRMALGSCLRRGTWFVVVRSLRRSLRRLLRSSGLLWHWHESKLTASQPCSSPAMEKLYSRNHERVCPKHRADHVDNEAEQAHSYRLTFVAAWSKRAAPQSPDFPISHCSAVSQIGRLFCHSWYIEPIGTMVPRAKNGR